MQTAMKEVAMSAETAAAGALAAKYGLAAKLAALIGTGVVGALLIAAVDPAEAVKDPKQRRRLIFAQVIVAIVAAGMVGPVVVSWLVKPGGLLAIDFSLPLMEVIIKVIEVSMPVGLILGGLSWGLIGAAVKLRQIIKDKGAQFAAGKVGL